jgi:sodium-coupled neutral amino acid transporter 11
MDSSVSRRTPDTTIPMYESGNQSSLSDLDLSEVAAKQHAGGGMLDSVANMANSILGAGKLNFVHVVID